MGFGVTGGWRAEGEDDAWPAGSAGGWVPVGWLTPGGVGPGMKGMAVVGGSGVPADVRGVVRLGLGALLGVGRFRFGLVVLATVGEWAGVATLGVVTGVGVGGGGGMRGRWRCRRLVSLGRCRYFAGRKFAGRGEGGVVGVCGGLG